MRRPPNEVERLARLRELEILDTAPEEAFDQIVSIASQICEAPAAFISLLDTEREWFKARLGTDLTSIDRTLSLCSETVLSDSPLIINDLSQDPRFSNNPLVINAPNMRFYAGVPLITNDKLVLGALCILDKTPRQLSLSQQQALQALAHQVILQIELRHKLLKVQLTIDSLGESERRFRVIADASPVLLWISDQAGNRTFFNTAWREFTGLSREDSLADSWEAALHPDDREVYHQRWHAAALQGERFQREFRLRHSSGTYRWVLEQAMPLFSSTGRLEAYVSSCVDLSSRNTDELQYQNNEARFRAISEAAPLGIFVTDSDGNYIYTNNQFQNISGQSSEESFGSGWLRAIPLEDRERVASSWYAATKTATPFEETHRYQRHDGGIAWCTVKAATINSTDTVSGWVGTVDDITERREVNEELIAAKRAAETATHAKSQFLANMSHEIRTPLTAIIGFAESLRDDTKHTPEQFHTLDIILSNSKHLLNVINEILDLSKIDAGALTIEKTSFNLVRLVEEVRTMFAPRIADKALSFTVHYEWPLPAHITTDPLRLKQVLINLLSNAIKFTHNGSIELHVGFDSQTAAISFSIKDSGIGISMQQISSLFQPFCQANESITRQYGGTGLGLSISQRLINALGGEITVTSTIGAGSQFNFWISSSIDQAEALIRALPEEHPEVHATALPQKFSGRVLFADDALDNRRLVHHLLEKAGVDPTLVEDGEQAIESALAQPFDLILLDVQMPKVDGLSAARAIRQAGIKTPIVALSAGAMTSDVLKAIDAGCAMHLSKPFSKSSFLEMLNRFLNSAVPVEPLVVPIISSRISSDPDMLEIILEFVEHLSPCIEELSKTVELGDRKKTAVLAHRLRGSAGLYGYQELATACARLEEFSKDSTAQNIEPFLEEICSIVKRIEAGRLTTPFLVDQLGALSALP